MKREVHELDAVFDETSEILILGSFPSVKSREVKFYYGHPQNRFWKIMEYVYGVQLKSIESKKKFLYEHHLALWDVIESCLIENSSDASIQDVKVNDISMILKKAPIKKIIVNGKKAEADYNRYIYPITQFPCICLPSTSPANAAWRFDRLSEEWKKALLFD